MLRVWGLRWGLPNSLHNYSYHPDEFLIATAAFGSIYVGRGLNPRIYTYPSLYIYLSALAMAVGFGYGAAPALANVYLAARVVTVISAAAAVGATYWAGEVLFGRAAGLLAALVIAIAPLHVQHSHFGTVDVPSTLFVALALGYSGLILKRGEWRDYALAGVMSGLAAGTKYNAGLVILAPAATWLLADRKTEQSRHLLKAVCTVGCTLAGFVVSTPGSILWWREFSGGVFYEMRHAATGHGLVFAGTGNGFVYTLASSLRYGLGPALAALFVVSVVWALLRRDRRALMLLAFAVPYYVLISMSQVRFARYTLPLFPAVAVLVGWLITDWYRVFGERGSLLRLIWAGMMGLALLSTLGYSAALDSLFSAPDPRDQAAEWIFEHVEKGETIGVPEVPWFYSPPLAKSLGFGTLPQREEAARKTPYQLVVFSESEEPSSWWTHDRPKWVVVSDYETRDALRLRRESSISEEDRASVRRTLGDLDIVRNHYGQAVTFGPSSVWARELPHDMRYQSPTITIYRLRR